QTLHRYNFKDRKTEVFLSPVNDVAISHDRKSILYRSNATRGILGTSDSNKKIGDGKLESIASTKLKINPMEWRQLALHLT
ncbi:MAG: hypothetical protein ACKODM_15780, partial [Cytophagales bacterium]